MNTFKGGKWLPITKNSGSRPDEVWNGKTMRTPFKGEKFLSFFQNHESKKLYWLVQQFWKVVKCKRMEKSPTIKKPIMVYSYFYTCTNSLLLYVKFMCLFLWSDLLQFEVTINFSFNNWLRCLHLCKRRILKQPFPNLFHPSFIGPIM